MKEIIWQLMAINMWLLYMIYDQVIYLVFGTVSLAAAVLSFIVNKGD